MQSYQPFRESTPAPSNQARYCRVSGGICVYVVMMRVDRISVFKKRCLAKIARHYSFNENDGTPKVEGDIVEAS